MSLLSGTVVEVHTTLLPPIVVDVDAEARAPQGAFTRFARPKVVVKRGGNVLHSYAPAGDPAAAPPWGMVVLLGVAVLVGILALR